MSSNPLSPAAPPVRSLSMTAEDLELSTPPPEQAQDPLMSISTLADSLDGTSSIPDFLNDLLASSPPPPTANGNGNGVAKLPPARGALPPLENLETILNALLTRLTLLSQDTSSELEQSIHDISRTVPRLSYDLQFMRESASTLQLSLSTIQNRVASSSIAAPGPSSSVDPLAKVPSSGAGAGDTSDAAKTQKSLSHLTHLDTLKRRMESARDVLREAESWSTLEGEITTFIRQGEWDKAGARLSEASKSLVVFQATPSEYESRKALMVSLQNELETALSAALVTALDGVEAGEIAKFGRIFAQMDREEEFRKYYFTSKRKGVLAEWADWDGEGFAAFLPRWYGVLLRTVEEERAQISKIFPPGDAVDVLGEFIRTTLESLSPSLQTRLSTLADSLGATALPELIKAYRATEDLALAIYALLDRLAGSPAVQTHPLPSPTTPSTTPKSFFTPLRPTTTRNSTRDEEQPQKWEMTLYEPFLDLQTAYPTLEKRCLAHLLTHESSLARRDASGLGERTAAALALAAEAMGRCAAYTHGYGAKGLVDALGDFLAGFFDGQAAYTATTPARVEVPKDELDFGEGIDYTTEDWAAFQAALKVLTTCRDVGGKLKAFEEKVHTYLESALSPPGASTTTPGAGALLAQSPLNSADLHSLLSTLSPPAYPLVPARKALANLTRKSQISLQNIILSPLRILLAGYPNLPIWTQTEKPRKDGLSIPTFSLSPTDTMSRISEGLLNLLRVFEVHADDDALAYSLETLPHLDAEHLAVLLPPPAPSPHLSSAAHSSLSPSKPSVALPGGEGHLEPEMVIATWVSSLSLTLLADLTKKTLPGLKSLSGDGANQLSADLAYLGNAVRALDVEWEELEIWRGAAEMDEAEWRKRVKEEKGAAVEIVARMGRLRGWGAGAGGGVGGEAYRG